MRIQELITYIKSLVNLTLFPNAFPTTYDGECGVVTINPGLGVDSDTGVKRPQFQILVRCDHMEQAESKAYEIYDSLVNKKEQQIGAHSVVAIKSTGSAPFYIGMDERQRPIYSMNFSMVIRP